MQKKSRFAFLSISIVLCWLICTSAADFSSQWALSATATTEQPTHAASNVPAPPANLYWSPLITGQKSDSIEITVQNSICVTGITVYEYQVVGLAIGIYSYSPSGTWDELWSGPSNYGPFAGASSFSPNLVPVTYTTSKFKITFDSSQSGHAPQVDGIRVFGTSTCVVVTMSSQWTLSATATSEQSPNTASNIPTPPVNLYWSPKVTSQKTDSIEIVIQNSVCIAGITVFEYQLSGLAIGIYAYSPSGTWDQLWSGTSNYASYDGALGFSPTISLVAYTTNKFKVTFDSSQSGHPPQVNGVQVFGRSTCPAVVMTSQWALSATATTEQASHGASNVPAPPANLYWSPLVGSQKSDSIEIVVQNSVCVTGITVYEYQVVGLAIGIYSYSPSGTWEQLWSGTSNYGTFAGASSFSPNLVPVTYTTSKFKITFDSSQNGHAPQVDGIRVFGTSTCAVVTMSSQWTLSATATTEQPPNVASNVPTPPVNLYWSPMITSQKTDSLEIVVQYSVCVYGITVFEYQVSGLTIGIYSFSPSGAWDQLWSGASNYASYDGALGFSPTLTSVNYNTNKFKITFDSAQSGHPPQVNGVQVIGRSVCPGSESPAKNGVEKLSITVWFFAVAIGTVVLRCF